jgi:DNA-binding transcriptional LysR family regulator
MQAMEWDDLRFVLAVGRAGTLAGAARRLGVNQTTVARRIAAAESTLGCRLFRRVDGILHPTKSGEAAIASAARIEQSVEALRQERLDTTVSGTVRLTCVPVLANRLFVPALPRLFAGHPGLRVELIAEPRNLNLTRREADLAVRLARPEGVGPHLTKRLGQLDYAVYGLRGRQAGRLCWITYEEGLGHLPQARWIAKTSRGEHIAPFSVSDTETLTRAVRAGLGKSLLPRFVADEDSRLACLSGSGAVLSRELWLLCHRDGRGSAAVGAVMGWLERLAGLHLKPHQVR